MNINFNILCIDCETPLETCEYWCGPASTIEIVVEPCPACMKDALDEFEKKLNREEKSSRDS